jgi:hypothetical protein
MRTKKERDAAAVWLHQQHEQFFKFERESEFDFCWECRRIVPEGSEHDAAAHLAN